MRGETPSSAAAGEVIETSTPASAAPHDVDERMSLRDLTDAAGVSVRTVRYYISEGLLPPPEGAGPASAYTAAHLDRLRLIHQLKAAYLPLKEIRRRLSGLDDTAVRAQLALDRSDSLSVSGFNPSFDPSMADAREYLNMMESGQTYHTEPLGLGLSPSTQAPAPARTQRLRHQPVPVVGAHAQPQPAQERTPTLWHHIPLGDDAELVISDQAYARHPDRVDWLVRWARKVFD
jgi:DNA-binding transcriptional MerR regulator